MQFLGEAPKPAGVSQEMDSDPPEWGLVAPSTTRSGTGSWEGTALLP